jgi:cyclopropane fatty-acyl-phospholipid synthase-like methyltransferase
VTMPTGIRGDAMDTRELPFSEAADRNKGPILDVVASYFKHCKHVLEIGSGTGQHAIHFATNLPHVQWHASDRAENVDAIARRIRRENLKNVTAPLIFDVNQQWPQQRFDGVFTANTLHIMPWPAVCRLFAGLPTILDEEATVIVYGPFKYRGVQTSDSNAHFDEILKRTAAHQGIRDFEAVDEVARQAGLNLLEDREMPANNRCLVWRVNATGLLGSEEFTHASQK